MTEKLETVLEKVSSIANPVNSLLILEFYKFMTDNLQSDDYKNNYLKVSVPLATNLLLISPCSSEWYSD
jgi:hypothetical protein